MKEGLGHDESTSIRHEPIGFEEIPVIWPVSR